MKQRLQWLAGCFFLSTAAITALFLFSTAYNHRKNGFVRLFPPHALSEPAVMDIHYEAYYIAGLTAYHIYLANYNDASHILSCDRTLIHSSQLAMIPAPGLHFAWQLARVSVDSPYVYLAEGLSPSICMGDIVTGKMHSLPLASVPFNASLMLSPVHAIVRVHQPSLQKNVLALEKMDSPVIRFAPNILQKQVDGFFCTDGLMKYSQAKGLLVYLYFYRNQFLCLDTNLHLLYRANTIDTNSTAKFSVGQISSSHTLTFSSPALTVNRNLSLDGDRIYVRSNLEANNEEEKFFKEAAVIDVYDVHHGKYQFSFYIPDYKKMKLTDFMVQGHQIIAVYNHFLLVFPFNL